MDDRRKDRFLPWSSRMVAEVELICRSRIPVIPHLDPIQSIDCILTDCDYDFIRERQAVTDYEQYWEEKHRIKRSTPSPSHGGTTQTSTSQLPGKTSSNGASPEVKHDLCPPTCSCLSVATVSDPRIALQSDAARATTQITWTAPVAARQLKTGEVLLPNKSDGCSLPVSSTVLSQVNNDSIYRPFSDKQSKSGLCLSDFDSGPDDPFASVELKTINDMEELKSVLLFNPDVKLIPPVTRSIHPSGRILSKMTPNFTLEHSPGFFTTNASITCGVYTAPLQSVSQMSSSNFVSSHRHLPIVRPPLHLYGGPVRYRPDCPPEQINASLSTSRKSLSSSFPNLEVAVGMERSKSAMGLASSRDSSQLNPSPPPPTHPIGPHSLVSSCLRVPSLEDARARALLAWAKLSGHPESRAHQLIQMRHNRLRFFGVTLEKAQQHLADQLYVIDVLLREYSSPRYKTNLSEQSAVVAASSFPDDLFRARQFAEVTLELEQSGHAQKATQAYLLNSRLGNEAATLAHLLSAFPQHAPSSSLPRTISELGTTVVSSSSTKSHESLLQR